MEIKPTKLIKGQGLAKMMAETNLHVLDINLIAALSDEDEENSALQVSDIFVSSPWYADIVYVLQNLSSPPGMPRNKANIEIKGCQILHYQICTLLERPRWHIAELFS